MSLLISTIRRDILSGNSLHHTMRKHTRYFDPLTCQLIQIGEHTGKINIILTTLADHHEKKLALHQQIKRALFYPCIITITAILITLSMFFFVIPKFAELFQGTHTTLPLLTLCIFYLSSLLQKSLWPCLSIIIICIIVICHPRSSGYIRKPLHTLITRLPIIHPHIHKTGLAQFCRNLALSLDAGISITDALKLTANASHHPELSNMIMQLRSKVSTGLQLHTAMTSLSYFPVLMIQMVKTGEETGMLEHMLGKVAEFFESDVAQVINLTNQLLEPLIMIILGVLIGGLVIGMYLPIFKLGSTL